jgi:hypothetical protein
MAVDRIPPQFPAGPFEADEAFDEARRAEHVAEIAAAPARLREAVGGLRADQLEATYRNWTIRQITHHIVDSHLNAYVRFKLALTEERPTIKPYFEGRWADLPDGRRAEVEATLAMMEGLHARWVYLLQAMTPAQFARAYFHPESQAVVPLFEVLGLYAWHGRHHTAQVRWVRTERLGLSG